MDNLNDRGEGDIKRIINYIESIMVPYYLH